MFIAKSEKYAANTKQAANLTAVPAIQNTPDGRQPAILLRSPGMIHGVLPVADALRVANQIADALAAHRTSPRN